MKKILILLVFLNIYLFANQSILIINSYHKGYDFSDKIVSAMEKEFYKDSKLDINILYMDSKRVTTKEYFQNLKNLYKVQLNNRKYDLVIAIDRFAYDFILENYIDFFKNIPVLSVGIENFSMKNAQNYGLEKVSALLERRDLDSNIKLIEKSFPSLKKVYIINDKSINALHTQPLIFETIKKHKKSYKLEYLQANSLSELKDKFSQVKKDEAILFIRFYKNSDETLNKNQEIAEFLNSSKIPIYVTDSIFIERGALGGKIVDLNKFGFQSAKMAFNILDKSFYEIKYFEDLDYVFDEQKVKEFLIFPSSLVKDYILLNKSLTFYDKNRGFINIVFTISPLLLILIILLVKNVLMRKKMQLVEEEKQKNRQFIIQQSKLAEIGEVFSSIAHQWKSPLVEITAIAQEQFYIRNNSLQKEDESFVSDIMEQVTYMTNTINDFQKFIMPSNTKTEFDVNIAIKSILEIINHNIKYNNIKINIKIKKETCFLIYGYKNEFMQSFLNIINNAKDALFQNDSKNRKIDIILFNSFDKLIILIQDNAGGIDENNIKNIFEAYYTTKKDGHGIGLYMSKMIIEDKMNGKISVKNRKNGACFLISLGCRCENISS